MPSPNDLIVACDGREAALGLGATDDDLAQFLGIKKCDGSATPLGAFAHVTVALPDNRLVELSSSNPHAVAAALLALCAPRKQMQPVS